MKSEMFDVKVEEFEDPSIGSHSRRLVILANLRKRTRITEAQQALQELHIVIRTLIKEFETSTALHVTDVDLIPMDRMDGSDYTVPEPIVRIMAGL